MAYSALIFAGIVGFSLLLASTAVAQAPRPGSGRRPSRRPTGRNRPTRAVRRGSRPDDETADTTPAAETYHKGVDALDKGETDAAIALFEPGDRTGSKIRPGLLRPRLGPDHQGRVGQGRGRSGQAIKLAPGGAGSYFNRGFAYYQKGDYDKAVADYTDAIRLHPDYAEAYRDRGYILALTGDLPHALEDLNLAARLRRRTPPFTPAAARRFRKWATGTAPSPTTARQSASAEGRGRLVRSRQRPGDERRLRRRPGRCWNRR